MKVSHEKYMIATLLEKRGVITSKKSEGESSQEHPRGWQIKRFIRGSWDEGVHLTWKLIGFVIGGVGT